MIVIALAAVGSACDSNGDALDLQNRVEVAAGGYTSIAISATNTTIEVDQEQQMVLNALADEEVIGTEVTESAVWSVSDASVARITQAGVLTGLADGTVNVNARYGPLFTATTIRVSAAVLTSIEIVAPAQSVDECSSVQPENPDTPDTDITDNVAWSSSSTSIATVDNTLPVKGQVDAIRNGSVTISAACGSVSDATLTLLAGDPTVVETVFFGRSSPFDITFNSERQFQLRSFVRLENQQNVEITEDSDWTFVNRGNSQNELNNNDDFKGLLTIRGTGRIVVQVEYTGDAFDETDSTLNTPRLEINVR